MVRVLHKVNCLDKIQYGHSIMLLPIRETVKSLEAVADYTVVYTESMSEVQLQSSQVTPAILQEFLSTPGNRKWNEWVKNGAVSLDNQNVDL